MIIADPLNVMRSDRHLEPPEPDQYIDDGIRYIVSKAMPELLTIHLELPPEPDEEIDFVGLCECDECRKAMTEPDVHPKEIWRGTAYFKLDNRLIHWECLQDYLISRQRIGG